MHRVISQNYFLQYKADVFNITWKKKFCGSRIIKVFLQACPLALCSRYYCEGSRLPIMCVLNHFSHVWLFVTLWTVAPQAPPSMGFSRQEYWNGLPCPPPGDLPDPGIEHASLTSPALAGRLFTTSDTWEALSSHFKIGYSELLWWLSLLAWDFKGIGKQERDTDEEWVMERR